LANALFLIQLSPAAEVHGKCRTIISRQPFNVRYRKRRSHRGGLRRLIPPGPHVRRDGSRLRRDCLWAERTQDLFVLSMNLVQAFQHCPDGEWAESEKQQGRQNADQHRQARCRVLCSKRFEQPAYSGKSVRKQDHASSKRQPRQDAPNSRDNLDPTHDNSSNLPSVVERMLSRNDGDRRLRGNVYFVVSQCVSRHVGDVFQLVRWWRQVAGACGDVGVKKVFSRAPPSRKYLSSLVRRGAGAVYPGGLEIHDGSFKSVRHHSLESTFPRRTFAGGRQRSVSFAA